MTPVDPFWAYISILLIASFAVAVYLMVNDGTKYERDAAKKATERYAGIIDYAQGRVTTFLWASYLVLIVWAIGYLYLHINEFFNLGY
jgi:hypothetical protein